MYTAEENFRVAEAHGYASTVHRTTTDGNAECGADARGGLWPVPSIREGYAIYHHGWFGPQRPCPICYGAQIAAFRAAANIREIAPDPLDIAGGRVPFDENLHSL